MLQGFVQQDPDFIPESIPVLEACYDSMASDKGLFQYLNRCLERYPSVSVLLALSRRVAAKHGDEVAGKFLGDQLKKKPSIRGLSQLIDLHIKYAEGSAKENLSILKGFTSTLLAQKPVYRCGNCGFSGKQLHWLCPSCHTWGVVKPIQGLEGD